MSKTRYAAMNKRIIVVALSLLAAAIGVAVVTVAFHPDEAEVRQKNWPAPYETAHMDSGSQVVEPVASTEVGDGTTGSKSQGASDDAAQLGSRVVTEIVEQENGIAYAANQVLLSFDGTLGREELTSRLARDGVEVQAVEVVSNALDDNEVLVRVTYRGDRTPAQLSKELQKFDYVSTAEPDYLQTLCDTDGEAQNSQLPDDVEPDSGAERQIDDALDSGEPIDQLDAIPNDTRFSSQWGLTAIGAPAAWDSRKSQGAVTVAVIDSGVDYTHPDLSNNLVNSSYALNTYSNTYGLSAVNDPDGHGTHVAGIIAAETSNATGVSGVSYNAKVLPIRVLPYKGAAGIYDSDVIEAIDYVVTCKNNASSPSDLRNIRVINLSLGSYTK